MCTDNALARSGPKHLFGIIEGLRTPSSARDRDDHSLTLSITVPILI